MHVNMKIKPVNKDLLKRSRKREKDIQTVENMSKQLFHLHRYLVNRQRSEVRETLTTIQTMLDSISE